MKRVQEVIGDRYEHLCRNGKINRGGQALLAGAGKHGDRVKGHGGENRVPGGSPNGGGKGGRGPGRRSKRSSAGKIKRLPHPLAQLRVPSQAQCHRVPAPASTASSPPSGRSSASAAPAHRRCNVCNSTDHFMSHCPKRICAVCGGRGHWATECGTSTACLAVADASENVLQPADCQSRKLVRFQTRRTSGALGNNPSRDG